MKIGSKVKLNPSGFKNDKYNPFDTDGVVMSFDGKYSPIIVEWSNGIINSYYEKNLVVIEE
jgi:hypothetical protein